MTNNISQICNILVIWFTLLTYTIHIKSAIFKVNLLWILHLFRKFTIKTKSVSRIHEESTMNSLSSSRFHQEFVIFFANSLNVSRISCKFTICFAIFLWIHHLFGISLWIHYFFRYLTMNSLSVTRIHEKFTVNFANSPWIHFSPPYHYKFTIFSAILHWNHYHIPEITINLLSFSRYQ